MYGTIKKGASGDDVKLLCHLLEVSEKNIFDEELDKVTKEFQTKNDLVSDGIVGWNTWKTLLIRKKSKDAGKVTEEDFNTFADLLGCEVAALKAVLKVETGGRSGFLASGRPQILFEAHLFYKNLKKTNANPDFLMTKYPNLISKTWNKALYKGGEKEWDRLEEARKINTDAANMSASFGLGQILGSNYMLCNCKSVQEFVDKNCESEYQQLLLFIEFLRKTNLVQYLKTKDWAKFANGYNGPGYKQNAYDTKLQQAYNSYKK